MAMRYEEFLRRVVDEGERAAAESYKDDPPKRRGAVAGFRACEGKSPAQLAKLLEEAGMARASAYHGPIDDYWEARCYEAEVEWVCKCVSAALLNMGLPAIVPVTARAVIKAASILGVSGGLDAVPDQD